MRCEDKIVLVTGAQRGIGKAVARRMVQAQRPGVTDTAMPRLGNTEEGLAEMAQRLPTGRLAEPEEIADVIMFLATNDARHIMGQLIHVNGGNYLS